MRTAKIGPDLRLLIQGNVYIFDQVVGYQSLASVFIFNKPFYCKL